MEGLIKYYTYILGLAILSSLLILSIWKDIFSQYFFNKFGFQYFSHGKQWGFFKKSGELVSV